MALIYPHGTLGRHRVGCRCKPCIQARKAYLTDRNRQIAYGTWTPYADAQPVREHITYLNAQGMSAYQIARLSGVSPRCIHALMNGVPHRGLAPTPRLLTANAEALLAVRFDLDAIADRAKVDACGTRRRAQGLATIGYSLRWQAAQLGKKVSNYHDVVSASRVFASTARQVRGLYDRWSMTIPAETRIVKVTRTAAAKNKWLPPAAWDDDLIDLPEGILQVELARMVAEMDEAELRSCYTAHRFHGDLSPLTVAACTEYRRLRRQSSKESAA